MRQTAKLFTNGRSQAVRLPAGKRPKNATLFQASRFKPGFQGGKAFLEVEAIFFIGQADMTPGSRDAIGFLDAPGGKPPMNDALNLYWHLTSTNSPQSVV